MFKLTKRSFTALLALVLVFSMAALFACSQTENDNDNDNVFSTTPMVSGSLVLRADGTVWEFARESTEEESSLDLSVAEKIEGLDNIVYIATLTTMDIFPNFALRYDGTVWAWGHNEEGRLGDGTTTYRPYPIQLEGLSDIVKISHSGLHTLALQRDGTVWAWGWNMAGQIGDGTTEDRNYPKQVNGLPKITSIVVEPMRSFALCENGAVWAWGWGVDSNGVSSAEAENVTTRPIELQNVPAIASIEQGRHGIVLISQEGRVYTDAGFTNFFLSCWEVDGMVVADRFVRVAFALCEQGNVWTWDVGEVEFIDAPTMELAGQIHGLENIVEFVIYRELELLSFEGFDEMLSATSVYNGLFLGENGYLWRYSLCVDSVPVSPTLGIVEGLERIVAIQVEDVAAFAFVEDGTLWAWIGMDDGFYGLARTPQQVEFRAVS